MPQVGRKLTGSGSTARPLLAPARDNRGTVSRLSLAVALLVLIAAPAGACRRAPSPSLPDTVTFGRVTSVSTLDPALAEARTASVVSNVFEPLVAYDRNLELVPALATRWSTPDEKTWDFVLRPGVSFHDGTPFDSAAAVAALDRARNAPGSSVAGALWAVSSVEATGPLAIRIRTRTPDALLLQELTLVLLSRAAAGDRAALVGTGPYRVTTWDRHGTLVLAAWERHWAGPPPIRAIRIVALPGGRDAAVSVAAAEVDVAEVPLVRTRSAPLRGVRFLTSPGLTTYYLWMNGGARVGAEPNPFFDVRVRRAVGRSVDRARLALEATGSEATAAPQLVPPTVVGHTTSVPPPPFDPAAARKILAEAGYRLPLPVTLVHISDDGIDAVARLVKEMLDAAGFRVTLRSASWRALVSEQRDGRVGLLLGGWVFDTPDAGGFLRDCIRSRQPGSTTGVFNPGYASPEVDRLVDASHASLSGSQRLTLLEKALRIAAEDAPFVPLFHRPDAWAVSARLDWRPRPDGLLLAREMRFLGGGR